MAGHFVHARNPVGRYQRDNSDQHVEIRSVGSGSTPTAMIPPLSATPSSCCGRPCAATGTTP
ncbi:hypothetical protein ACFQ3Z_00470 [Streptomyces nogalater]